MAKNNIKIYGKEVNENTIMYILGRFLKEHNYYHLWKYCITNCPSTTFTYSKFLKDIEQKQFRGLINNAPFDWHEERINDALTIENYPLNGYNNRWNHFSFWTKVDNEWRKLIGNIC